MGRIGIVVVGGDPPDPTVKNVLPLDPLVVVAADSGFDHAVGLELTVDVLVGDLDSISAGGLSLAETTDGVAIERHRPEKDFTDTELAITIALERGAQHLIGVCGGGNRLDHQLGTLAAFAAAAQRPGVTVEVWWKSDHIAVLAGPTHHDITIAAGQRDGEGDGRASVVATSPAHSAPKCGALSANLRAEPPARAEYLVSLVPFGGAVSGVTTGGLRYPLSSAVLATASARGISNVVVKSGAFVEIGAGTLLVITPGVLS